MHIKSVKVVDYAVVGSVLLFCGIVCYVVNMNFNGVLTLYHRYNSVYYIYDYTCVLYM